MCFLPGEGGWETQSGSLRVIRGNNKVWLRKARRYPREGQVCQDL